MGLLRLHVILGAVGLMETDLDMVIGIDEIAHRVGRMMSRESLELYLYFTMNIEANVLMLCHPSLQCVLTTSSQRSSRYQ